MNGPTEQDREAAAELLRNGYRQEAIAGALAAERAKARAPFLALADELERGYLGLGETFAHGADKAFRASARHIRRAAEDPS